MCISHSVSDGPQSSVRTFHQNLHQNHRQKRRSEIPPITERGGGANKPTGAQFKSSTDRETRTSPDPVHSRRTSPSRSTGGESTESGPVSQEQDSLQRPGPVLRAEPGRLTRARSVTYPSMSRWTQLFVSGLWTGCLSLIGLSVF